MSTSPVYPRPAISTSTAIIIALVILVAAFGSLSTIILVRGVTVVTQTDTAFVTQPPIVQVRNYTSTEIDTSVTTVSQTFNQVMTQYQEITQYEQLTQYVSIVAPTPPSNNGGGWNNGGEYHCYQNCQNNTQQVSAYGLVVNNSELLVNAPDCYISLQNMPNGYVGQWVTVFGYATNPYSHGNNACQYGSIMVTSVS